MTYDQVAHEEEEEEEKKINLEKLCIISLSSTPVMEDARKKNSRNIFLDASCTFQSFIYKYRGRMKKKRKNQTSILVAANKLPSVIDIESSFSGVIRARGLIY